MSADSTVWGGAAPDDWAGSIWDGNDRSIKVLREVSRWRGERQYLVQGIGSGRTYHIGMTGLLRKYKRRAGEVV